MPDHWATNTDMFDQGVRTLDEALNLPVDHEKVLAHFRSRALLKKTGLNADDIGISHVLSHADIAKDLKQHPESAEVDYVYLMANNLSVQSIDFCPIPVVQGLYP